MKRGSFLKFLGFGAGVAAVAKGENKKAPVEPKWDGSTFDPEYPNGYPSNESKKDNTPFTANSEPEYTDMKPVICYEHDIKLGDHPGRMCLLLHNGNIPKNYIELKGQGILREKFRKLDQAVYVDDICNNMAGCFYHSDDPAGEKRNPKGKYLILPDSREMAFQ